MIICDNSDKPLTSSETWFPLGVRRGELQACPGCSDYQWCSLSTVPHSCPSEIPRPLTNLLSTSLLFTSAAQENDLVKAHYGTKWVKACGSQADQVCGVRKPAAGLPIYPSMEPLPLLSESRSSMEFNRPCFFSASAGHRAL